METSGNRRQVSSATAVPFEKGTVAPDSYLRQHAEYGYAVTGISGIPVNRLSDADCGSDKDMNNK